MDAWGETGSISSDCVKKLCEAKEGLEIVVFYLQKYFEHTILVFSFYGPVTSFKFLLIKSSEHKLCLYRGRNTTT